MKKVLLTAVIACLVLGLTNQSEAFDGNRKGFVLGFGLGYGQSSMPTSSPQNFNYYSPNAITKDESYSGLCTDFKIGAGLSNQVMLYWTSKVAWISNTGGTSTYGLGGLGGAYYFNPEGPSFYLTGLIGFSSITELEDSGSAEMGSGMSFGGGYELSNHYSIEANYVSGSVEEKDLSGFRVTFNALAF